MTPRRNGLLLATNIASTRWAFRAVSAAAGEDGRKSWVIGNEEIARTIVFQTGKGLYTDWLSDLSMHADYIVPASIHLDTPEDWAFMAQEFSFQCNNQVCRGPEAYFASKSRRGRLPHCPFLT